MNNGIKNDQRVSTVEDWEGYYDSRFKSDKYNTVDISDFRSLPHKIILETVQKYYRGGNVLEVGAGDSDMLIDICKKIDPPECYGLDYVESACNKLLQKTTNAGLNIDVVCADMFSPPDYMKNKFDFVMSYGVVEHFHNLPAVLRAIASFATDGGIMFTLIPNNKNTIYGFLMRCWNKDVYNSHVMYDASDLEEAHKNAGLELLWTGYLVSSNFGMLSWCFRDRNDGLKFWLYKQLTRMSKLVWLAESRIGLLKPLRAFAPYIVSVSKVVR